MNVFLRCRHVQVFIFIVARKQKTCLKVRFFVFASLAIQQRHLLNDNLSSITHRNNVCGAFERAN